MKLVGRAHHAARLTLSRVAWSRRHPRLAYFAFTYGISWGGILMVLSTTGFDLTVLRPWDAGLVFVAMLLGPSVAGLTMTGLLGGRSALRGLGGRRCHSQ